MSESIKSSNKDNLYLRDILNELIERYPRYGFPKLFQMVRRKGLPNHKRVHRVYCKMGLSIRRKGKQRSPSRNPAIDFMSDSLVDGRTFRTFNIVDDYNREALAIEVDLNLPAERIIRVLDRLAT